MVHSALKRKRSLEELSDGASREDAPLPDAPENSQEATFIDIPQTPSMDTIWKPLPDEFEDPRPTMLALLSFLSDAELFTLVSYRVAHAAPYGPPLYLTPFCISGMHDFFIPQRSAAESFPYDATGDSPFTKIPKLRDKRGHMNGKVTGKLPKERAAAMLVSIATLLHFLNPQELRMLIRTRVTTSEEPHQGVRWFLEFMSSGGDGVPRGKRDLDQRKARVAKKNDEAKRMKAEKRVPPEMGIGEGASQSSAAPVSSVPPDAAPATDPPPPASFPRLQDEGREEGEVSPRTSAPVLEPSTRKRTRARKKKKHNRDGQSHISRTLDPPPPSQELS